MMGTKVYVGRLSYDCTERDLEKFFRGFGRVRNILIKNGFGFVEFNDHRDAEEAVNELNGRSLLGERVIVEIARGPSRRTTSFGRGRFGFRGRGGWLDKYGPPTRTKHRLIVENLSSRVRWQDLKDYMYQGGEVTYADAHKRRKNEGVVEFATYSDMKNALNKLHNTDLQGRKIRLVEVDVHRKGRRSHLRNTRSRSRSQSSRSSHSRSHSRGPSKSHSRSPLISHSRSRSLSASHKKSQSKSPSRSPPKAPAEKSDIETEAKEDESKSPSDLN